MSQPLSPPPRPASPTPSTTTLTPSEPSQPYLPNPGESAILWLAIGVATLFTGYLVVDGIIHRLRSRRSERRWREQAHRAALQGAAETQVPAHEAGRSLSEQPSTMLPPRR